MELLREMKNNSDFSGPLTSFDWNPNTLNFIATSSIDSTVTIWDINQQQVVTQLVAHDGAVHDIQFAENQRFGTVGFDGSVRVFDLNALESSTIIYETQDQKPLMKIAWNPNDLHQLAVIPENSNEVLLLDQRRPNQHISKFRSDSTITSICWHPEPGQNRLCTVSNNGVVLIYDVNSKEAEQ